MTHEFNVIFDPGTRKPGHIPALLKQRRRWAKEHGVDADFVGKVYRILNGHSFDVQARLWRKANRA